MEKDLKIRISIDKQTGELKVINGEFTKLSGSVKKTDKGVDGLNKRLKNMVHTAVPLYAINRAFRAVANTGFAFNKGMEDSVAGLTALTVATSANVSAMGKHLSITEKYALANKEATKTAQELAKINAQTPHTLDQTNQIYKAMYVSMKKAGASTQDMIGLTKKISIAAGAGGIEFNSLLAGVDGLATGTVLANSDLGRFLGGLGLTNEALKNSTDVVALLNEKLKDFKAVDNMTTAVSNLQNEWEQLAGVLTKDIFDVAKDNIKDTTSFLGTFRTNLHDFMLQYKDVGAINNIVDLKEKSVQLQIELLKLEEDKPSRFAWNSEKKAWRERKEAIQEELKLTQDKIDKQNKSDALLSNSSKWLTKIAKQRDDDFAMVSDMWDAQEKRDEESLKNTLANAKTASDKQILLNEELNKELASKNPYDMLSAKAQEYIKEAKGNQKNLLLIGEWYSKAFSALEDKTHKASLKKAKKAMDEKYAYAKYQAKKIKEIQDKIKNKYTTSSSKEDTEQFKTDWGVIVSNTFSEGMQDAFDGNFDFGKIASSLGSSVGSALSSAGMGQATKELKTSLGLGDGVVGGLETAGIGFAISGLISAASRQTASVEEKSAKSLKKFTDAIDKAALSLGNLDTSGTDYLKKYNEYLDSIKTAQSNIESSRQTMNNGVGFDGGIKDLFKTIFGGTTEAKDNVKNLNADEKTLSDLQDKFTKFQGDFLVKNIDFSKMSLENINKTLGGIKSFEKTTGWGGKSFYNATGAKLDIKSAESMQSKIDDATLAYKKTGIFKDLQDVLKLASNDNNYLLYKEWLPLIEKKNALEKESIDNSKANIKELSLRNETPLAKIKRLAGDAGSGWSIDPKGIDRLVKIMETSGGVFTNEEKKAALAMYDYSDSIIANRKAVEDAIKGQEYGQAQFIDSLNGTSTALEYAKNKVGLLGDKLPGTKDKLIALRQSFIDNDGAIDTYEQAVIDATLATKPLNDALKKTKTTVIDLTDNLNTWIHRNDTAKDTAWRLSQTLGVDMVDSIDALNSLANTFLLSGDGITDTELEMLQANETYINEMLQAEEDKQSDLKDSWDTYYADLKDYNDYLVQQQINGYEEQKNTLNDYLSDVSDDMSTLESSLSSLSDVIAKLNGLGSNPAYSLTQYYDAMSRVQSLSGGSNTQTYSDALNDVISKSSILFNGSAFNNSDSMEFAQLVAARQFESMENTTLSQVDILGQIEENTRGTMEALGGQISDLSNSISGISTPTAPVAPTETISVATAPVTDSSSFDSQFSAAMATSANGGMAFLTNELLAGRVDRAEVARYGYEYGMGLTSGADLENGIKYWDKTSLTPDSELLRTMQRAAMENGNFFNSFAVGTTSVPHDMLANIHKEEIIIPKDFSQGLRSGDLAMGSFDVLVKKVEVLTDEVKKLTEINVIQAKHIRRIDQRDETLQRTA